MLKLLCASVEELFAVCEEEDTIKKAMVRNLWTVVRPNMTEKKFEIVTQQDWAKQLEARHASVEGKLDSQKI